MNLSRRDFMKTSAGAAAAGWSHGLMLLIR